jgi:hypothetical protein
MAALPGADAAALEAMSDSGAYAVFGAPTLARLSDDAFRVVVRSALHVPVLRSASVPCREVGTECRSCPRETGDRFAADRHARVCKRGGGVVRVHDQVRSAVARVMRDWGVAAMEECGDFMAPDCGRRMDLLVPAGGRLRGALAVDFTRRVDASREQLATAERGKVTKYTPFYAGVGIVEVCGFAFDQFGRLGPMAREVVERVVCAGVRACGAHEDDFRAELLGAYSRAVFEGMALQYARMGRLAGDTGCGVPVWAALRPAGTRRPGDGRVRRLAPGSAGGAA